jgi:hypothetical protein
MAQTIQIKRSSTTTTPSSLASGELAYSTKTGVQKLYYGDGTDVLAIGGKSYTDKLDGIESGATADQTNAEIRAAVEAATDSNVFTDADHTKLDGIEALADVTDATNVAAAGALMLTGGTLTSDLVLGDNNKVQFGGTTTNLEIYNDGTTSYITENASGNLEISATDFNIKDGGGQTMMSFDADGSLRIYDQSATSGLPVQRIGTTSVGVSLTGQTTTTSLKFGNETVIVDSIKDEDNMSSDSPTALATQQSIKAYVDASVPTSVANATTAATATNVNLTSLANDSSDTGPKYLTFSDVNSGSQSLETQDLLKYNPDSATLTLKNLEVESGLITGPSVITIDPNATGATGEVIIQGDLTVKGTTTTIDSNTISVGDNIIRLNGDLAANATPTQDAGIEVFRGSTSTIQLKWDEQYGTTNAWGAQGQWMITDGTGTNNHYALLATHNAQYETWTINGGTF